MTHASGEAPPDPRPSAAQRQLQHLARSARQRERLADDWELLEPTLATVDATVSRVESLRQRIATWAQHPLALPIAAVALSMLVGSRRGRRLIGGVGSAARLAGSAARLAGGAAAAGSLLAALRDQPRVKRAVWPRASAGVRSGAPGDPSRWRTGRRDRPS